MPFSKARYGTRAKFNKMKRCVKKVGTKGKYNPYAVCRASIYKPAIKNVKKGMVFKTPSGNYLKVTQRPYFKKVGDRPDIFYGRFVKPTNFNQKRLPDDRELAIWDFEFAKGYKRVR